MGHTTNAVQSFIDGLESGRVKLAPSVQKRVTALLRDVARDERGGVILSTCSDELRSVARAFATANRSLESPPEPVAPSSVDPVAYTRELFFRLNAVFLAMTGEAPTTFAADGEFAGAVRRLGASMSGRRAQEIGDSVSLAVQNLQALYRMQSVGVLNAASALGGTKLVFGGQQSFSGASFEAVRSMALYADTILIPDPIMRRFEGDMKWERFTHPQMLQEIWWLLKLRPLVDANLPVPPIVLFPSYEKLLEENDPTTQFGLEREVLQVFSRALNGTFDDFSEVQALATAQPGEFMAAIAANRLFVPMNGSIGMEIKVAVARHRAELRKWRSAEFMKLVDNATDAQLVCSSIYERLTPLFHLSENALSLRGAPLLGQSVHWHFAQIRRDACAASASKQGVDDKTLALLRTLEDGPSVLLGNVPMADIVRLRGEGANRIFRERMARMMARLSETDAQDLTNVAGEVAYEFRSIVAEHDADIRRIEERAKVTFLAAGASALVPVASLFLPWFPAPLATGVATAVGAAFVSGAVRVAAEKRQLRGTLVGVLAASARQR